MMDTRRKYLKNQIFKHCTKCCVYSLQLMSAGTYYSGHMTYLLLALTCSCIKATRNAILSSFVTELRVFIVLRGPVNKKYKLFQSSQNAQDDYTTVFTGNWNTQKIIAPLSCYTITFVARCIHVFYAQKTTVQTIVNRDRDLPKSDICSSVSLIRLFYIYKLKIVCCTLH